MMTVYSSLSLKCQSAVGVTLDQGFLNLSATDILDQMILCCGAALCLLTVQHISDLHPLDASTSSPLTTPEMPPGIAQCPLGEKLALFENYYARASKSQVTEVKAGAKLSSA